MNFDSRHTEQYLTPEEYEAYVKKHMPALETVDANKYDSEMLGWVHTEDCLLYTSVHEVVGTLIVEFGSVGKASRVEQVTLGEMAERYRREGI